MMMRMMKLLLLLLVVIGNVMTAHLMVLLLVKLVDRRLMDQFCLSMLTARFLCPVSWLLTPV